MNDKLKNAWAKYPPAAGGGLIDRRAFLEAGVLVSGGAAILAPARNLAAETLPPSMRAPGRPMSAYGQPAKYEETVQRLLKKRTVNVSPGTGSSRTPLHRLNGIITPNGLHFERHPRRNPCQIAPRWFIRPRG